MKKAIALSMAAAMVLGLTACGGSSSTASTTAAATEAAKETQAAAAEAPAEAGDFTFDKTVNVYITHGAGGDTDYMARMLSAALEQKLGVSVVCSNVTGSNGATCMQQ